MPRKGLNMLSGKIAAAEELEKAVQLG